MINRQNWQDTQAFLAFQEGTLQNDPLTIHRMRGALRHLLEWADSRQFGESKNFEPTFPAYMAKNKTQAGKSFSSSGSEKDLQIARQFFLFARSEWPSRYKNIAVSWVRTLQPSKRNSAQSRLRDHSHYSLESVLKIAALPFETLQDRRDIAAVCFLFLSGMRIAAFTSITIEGVDIAENDIYQLPEKGVMTKNRKAAVTHLLQIPELMKVVTAWDELVRAKLKPSDLWYSVMTRDGDNFEAGRVATKERRVGFSDRLKILCGRAEIPYLSPHKIRHGHVVYALKNVNDVAGLKSVSQNVMHNSIQITDSIYGGFSNTDVKRVVSAIGTAQGADVQPTQPADMQTLISVFSILLKDNPEAMKLLANLGKQKTPKGATR